MKEPTNEDITWYTIFVLGHSAFVLQVMPKCDKVDLLHKTEQEMLEHPERWVDSYNRKIYTKAMRDQIYS